MAVKKTILKGEDLCIRKEGIADGAISPGDLVSGAPNGTISAQAASTINDGQRAVCYERELTGDGITVDYALNDTILYALCPPGVEVLMNATAAVTAGAVLEAAAGGGVVTRTTGWPVGIALETIGAAGKLRVELL